MWLPSSLNPPPTIWAKTSAYSAAGVCVVAALEEEDARLLLVWTMTAGVSERRAMSRLKERRACVFIDRATLLLLMATPEKTRDRCRKQDEHICMNCESNGCFKALRRFSRRIDDQHYMGARRELVVNHSTTQRHEHGREHKRKRKRKQGKLKSFFIKSSSYLKFLSGHSLSGVAKTRFAALGAWRSRFVLCAVRGMANGK